MFHPQAERSAGQSGESEIKQKSHQPFTNRSAKNRYKETWLLTGWKNTPDETGGEYGPAGSMHNEPGRFRPDVGAEVDNNIAPSKKNVNSVSTV